MGFESLLPSPLPPSAGGTGSTLGVPVRQAATSAAGFTLVNGTPSILSWTAPNDGQLHRVLLWGDVNVSVATTGGLINIHLTDPGGTAGTLQMDAGTHAAAGFFVSASRNLLIQAGSTLTISQDSALTVGAAVFYAEIWGL